MVTLSGNSLQRLLGGGSKFGVARDQSVHEGIALGRKCFNLVSATAQVRRYLLGVHTERMFAARERVVNHHSRNLQKIPRKVMLRFKRKKL